MRRGAHLAAARRRLGRDRPASGKLHYRDEQGDARPAAAAPARPPSGDERRARRRHAAPPGMRLHVPPSALSAAMGWADWPARLQHLAPGPLVGDREVWLDGGHNPSAARQIAACAKHALRRRQAAAPDLRQPRDQGPARACSSRSRGIVAHVQRCRSPTTPASRPSDLVEIAARARLSAPKRTTVSSEALAAIPPDARVLIFGSLYLAGRSPRRERPGAGLGFRRAGRPSARCPASARRPSCGDAHPFEQHEEDRDQRRPPQSSGTPVA